MLFESLVPKIKKICFYFFIYYNFSFNSSFNLKFCVVLRIAIKKSHVKHEENQCMELPIMQAFLTYAPRNLLDA